MPCYNFLTQYRTYWKEQDTKDTKYIIGGHINVWSYLEEVETYDFVVICVQGMKCLCRQNTKIHLNSSEMYVFKPVPLNSSRITPHYTNPWTRQPKCTNKSMHVVRLKTWKDDTYCTWSPVWPNKWQSCQSLHSCRPPCSAEWSAGTGCYSA